MLSACVVALLATLLLATPAFAQDRRELVGEPITTRRLARLLDAYVAPTDAEASAIDRLHETYLERYFAEVFRPVDALIASMQGANAGSSGEGLERFLRDLDRLQAKAAEVDRAFLDAAAESCAPERRSGFTRLAESRERQRLLGGIATMAPMTFGTGGGIVDLPALLAHERYRSLVPAGQREPYDAFLRGEEQRLLGQARAFSAALRDAVRAMSKVIDEAQAAGPEGAAQVWSRAIELGADMRRAVASNATANRAAVARLAGILPDDAVALVRTDLAERTIAALGENAGFAARGGTRSALVRALRDPALPEAARAELELVLARWTRDNAEALERFADAIAIAPPVGPSDDPANVEAARVREEAGARVDEARGRIVDVQQEALSKAAELLGDRADAYVVRRASSDAAAGPARFMPARVEEPGEASGEADSGAPDSSFADAPDAVAQPFTAEGLRRIGVAVALDDATLSVADDVLASFLEKEWTPVVGPLVTTIASARQRRVSAGEDGTLVYDRAAAQAIDVARRALATAVFELDAKLVASLAQATGLAPDDPFLLLVRLERWPDALQSAAGGAAAQARRAAPVGILARAGVDPAAARRLLETSRPAIEAFVSTLPAALAEGTRLVESIEAAERRFSSRDPEELARASREYAEVVAALEFHERSVIEAYERTLRDAAAASGGPELADRVAKALRRAPWPAVYTPRSSASDQLAAALRLPGLDEDRRARIDALRAEYEQAYDALSATMCVAPSPIDGFDPRLRQEIADAAFLRDERTAKARAELRRILGPELARQVPGIAPRRVDPDVDVFSRGEPGSDRDPLDVE